jgi:hypothetical protein
MISIKSVFRVTLGMIDWLGLRAQNISIKIRSPGSNAVLNGNYNLTAVQRHRQKGSTHRKCTTNEKPKSARDVWLKCLRVEWKVSNKLIQINGLPTHLLSETLSNCKRLHTQPIHYQFTRPFIPITHSLFSLSLSPSLSLSLK